MLTATIAPSTSTSTTPTPTPTSSPTQTFAVTSDFTRLAPTTTLPFTCTADICTGTTATELMFRTLQDLINKANAKLKLVSFIPLPTPVIAVDGRITKGTLAAYLPVSRAIGGKLAIFDFTPDIKFLATNAATFAREIAQWLNITWVAATATVPGHWARLSAGQTAVLPVFDAPTQPLPLPLPTAPTTPTPTTPTPIVTMFVCPDGTRVSDLNACPKQQVPQPQPQQQPARVDVGPTVAPPSESTKPPEGPRQFPGSEPPPQSRRYAGCIARFNKTRKVFSIYCPVGTSTALGLASEQFRCLYGNCSGLGADEVTPAVPAGFVKAAETVTLPREGETPAGEERDKFFRVGNPVMWALFAGTAAVVGGGGYWVVRRRRRGA